MFDETGAAVVATDGFPDHGIHDGIWITETEGEGGAVTSISSDAQNAGCVGQNSRPTANPLRCRATSWGDKGREFAAPSTRWPDFADNMPPRPSIVVITKQGGGRMIGGLRTPISIDGQARRKSEPFG